MAFTAMTVLAFTACGGEDDPTFAGEPEITVDGGSATSVATTLEGGNTEAIEVVSAGPWMLKFQNTADETWCTPSVKVGGGGTTQLTFNLAQATADRQTVIDLIASGEIMGYPITATATITVKQNGDGDTGDQTNVAEIRAIIKALNLPSTSATADAVDAPADLKAKNTIIGVITSDPASKNLGNANMMNLQDENLTAQNAGLTLFVGASKIASLTPGTKVSITLAAAKVQNYNGALQLSVGDETLTTLETGVDISNVPVITVADAPNYESQLVKLGEVQTATEYAAGATYAQNFNANFIDKAGLPFIVRTATAANATFGVTEISNLSGPMLGIAGMYRGAFQLSPRTAADVAGLTQPRFTVNAEYTQGTVAETIAAGSGKNREVSATVAATHTQGILVGDNSGVMLVFIGAAPAVAVGDVVTVKGTTEQRNGVIQFGTVNQSIVKTGTGTFTAPTPTVMDGAAVTAYIATATANTAEYKYVKYDGGFVVDNNYYNVEIPGTTTKGSVAYGKPEWASLNGLQVTVEGWLIGGTANFLQTMATSVTPNTSTPYISADGTLSFTKDAGNQTVSFTSGNLGTNKVFAKITGTDAAQFSVPTGEVTSPVTVTALANTAETAKNATLTIYAAATENGTAVATATVSLTQAGVGGGDGSPQTIVFADFELENATPVTTLTKGDITLTCAKNGGNNDPAYYTTGEALRLYYANTMTLSGATITKVEFSFVAGNYNNFTTVSTGSYSGSTWTGSGTNVIFTSNPDRVGSSYVQTRIVSMVVTYTK